MLVYILGVCLRRPARCSWKAVHSSTRRRVDFPKTANRECGGSAVRVWNTSSTRRRDRRFSKLRCTGEDRDGPDDIRDVDPYWIEKEMLNSKESFPTSRKEAFFQAVRTGDTKGAVYSISTWSTAATFAALTYVSFTISFTGGWDEGLLKNFAGLKWLFLICLSGSVAAEVAKFVDSVNTFTNRRNM
ncbi:hypothetical protein CYMTET_5795 [Cymbomonas tetramitiformis]|uniref:Uncharacterized protein n=1 Tax=Cymbomonas tetramitiformis TaxID=36881 RepID=A0AAE0GYG1_9CHLO|nr:hypothetical protein CYMTET_5795 [Cymbomonas tetramitiformis]